MKILQPINTEQRIRILPREYPLSVKLVLYGDESKAKNEFTLTPIRENGYMALNFAFDFDNNKYYAFDVFNASNNDLIHRGRIFVTDQNIPEFTTVKDVYSPIRETNTTYVAYERPTFIQKKLNARLNFKL